MLSKKENILTINSKYFLNFTYLLNKNNCRPTLLLVIFSFNVPPKYFLYISSFLFSINKNQYIFFSSINYIASHKFCHQIVLLFFFFFHIIFTCPHCLFFTHLIFFLITQRMMNAQVSLAFFFLCFIILISGDIFLTSSM